MSHLHQVKRSLLCATHDVFVVHLSPRLRSSTTRAVHSLSHKMVIAITIAYIVVTKCPPGQACHGDGLPSVPEVDVLLAPLINQN